MLASPDCWVSFLMSFFAPLASNRPASIVCTWPHTYKNLHTCPENVGSGGWSQVMLSTIGDPEVSSTLFLCLQAWLLRGLETVSETGKFTFKELTSRLYCGLYSYLGHKGPRPPFSIPCRAQFLPSTSDTFPGWQSSTGETDGDTISAPRHCNRRIPPPMWKDKILQEISIVEPDL